MLDPSAVDRLLIQASAATFALWLCLVLLVHCDGYDAPPPTTTFEAAAAAAAAAAAEQQQQCTMTSEQGICDPQEATASASSSWRKLQGLEEEVPLVATMILSALAARAYFSTILDKQVALPTMAEKKNADNVSTTRNTSKARTKERQGSPRSQREWSGVLVAAACTTLISISTNLHLAFFKTPVWVDKVTGIRLYVMRYCEWIPLAFLMTFMAEAVDLEASSSRRISSRKASLWNVSPEPLRNALLQLLSSSAGLTLSMCPDSLWWSTTFTLSFLSFLNIYRRTWTKRKLSLEERLKASRNTSMTFLQQDSFHRRYYAYQLILSCAAMWSVLVVMFTVNAALHVTLPQSIWLRASSLSMVLDTIFDVLAKGLYLDIIVKIHRNVFDPDFRVQRQFQEMQSLMKVLWHSTTDVIIISVQGGDQGSTIFSPSFQTLLVNQVDAGTTTSNEEIESGQATDSGPSLLLHTKRKNPPNSSVGPDDCDQELLYAKYVDSNYISPSAGLEEHQGHHSPSGPISEIDKQSAQVQVAMKLLSSCWNQMAAIAAIGSNESTVILVHEIECGGDSCQRRSCEIKLSRRGRYGNESFVAIVRDVTERVKRLEAEQRATAEAVARQRDAQNINRFTRHEIKNGLLAGLELCAALRESFSTTFNRVHEQASTSQDSVYNIIESGMSKTSGMIGQVDQVLQQILDTVLAEAMARDVVNECYKANPQKLDLSHALRLSGATGTDPRFPFVFHDSESDLPLLSLDAQLLHYIHRNAISNAIKYGRKGGLVSTHVHYNGRHQQLTIEVVNQPGPGHERLLNLGKDATNAVFEQSTKLHDEADELSAGDGAWIMQKCAKNMGGTCSIAFDINQTIFKFQCPASPYGDNDTAEAAKSLFELPRNVYAIGIDDSWVQRKVLLRLINGAGVSANRRKVLGRSREELDSLPTMINALLNEDRDSKLFMLVDENLDFGENMMVSGSKMTQDILRDLDPSKRERILVLVRSANDSSEDIELYNERTHGFCSKTVSTAEGLLEVLGTAWHARFGSTNSTKSAMDVFFDDSDSERSISPEDLREVVESVDVLLKGKSSRDVKWDHLWSSLHALKGDIMVSDNKKLARAAEKINTMRGPACPEDFDERWTSIRQDVMEGIGHL